MKTIIRRYCWRSRCRFLRSQRGVPRKRPRPPPQRLLFRLPFRLPSQRSHLGKKVGRMNGLR